MAKSTSKKINLKQSWANLNDGVEEVDPTTLIINPDNFREHGELQEKIWAEYVRQVGFVGHVHVSRATRKVLDGEFRTLMAIKYGQKTISVNWVRCTEDQEAQILRLYNRFGELAQVNRIKEDILAAKAPSIGEFTAEIEKMLPKIKSAAEQIAELGDIDANLDLDDEDFGDFDFENEDEEGEEEDLFGNSGISGAKKRTKGPVKVVLKGDQVAQFRKILSDAGVAGQIGGERTVLVIMGH